MVAHLEDARLPLEDARRRLGDARRRLVIPAVIPTAGRSGDMTIADRQEIARAVIVLMGIVHPVVAHQLSVIRTTVIRTTVLRMTVFLAIAAPRSGLTAIARRATAIP